MTTSTDRTNEIIDKIKTHGYWRVKIRPLSFIENRFNHEHIKELLISSKVTFRGWDYPHISRREGITNYNNYIQNYTNWNEYIELWRMYLSGQFIHLFACTEDWANYNIFSPERISMPPKYGLEMIMTLFNLTEIYEFASRLMKNDIKEGIELEIQLNGMKDRRLVTIQFGRSLFDNYTCREEIISMKRKISYDELISKKREFAIADSVKILNIFNWINVPVQVLTQEQEKLVKGR